VHASEGQAETEWQGEGTVLVVDDEEVVRSVATSILEDFGLRVLVAMDGQEAVDIFSGDPSAIDCVLLDMTMPRMSGEEAFSEIRGIRKDVPVILSSGYDEQEATAKLGDADGFTFIQKPYAPRDLMEKVKQALER
jgi:CheY-like chemotaxis protein